MILVALPLFGGTALANEGASQFDQCSELGWVDLRFQNHGECVSVLAAGGGIWDLARDFLLYPDQANPNPDGAGNANVWWFFYNRTGLERDPLAYELLPNYTVVDPNREQWDVGDASNAAIPFPEIGLITGLDSMIVHPEISQLVVTGWRSPVEGTLMIRGEFRHVGGAGDGVAWFIERNDGREVTAVASGTLGVDERVELDLTANMQRGDFLYFSVAPCAETVCTSRDFDSTLFDVTISGPKPPSQ